ncbi:MAG: hypothetical protein CBR30_01515 [Dictyoglomus sp. NZ13-RE01]|nr:MAG: hypothetical protein CBR30_01515 [Dictyoglomus sp. NZ13-RE01]
MKKEFIVLFSILIIAFIIWVYFYTSGQAFYLVVEVNNKEVMRINLAKIQEKKVFSVEGVIDKSYFEYDPKYGVRMIASPCPDKLCVKQGWIKKVGESIVCLPNRVVLRLEGKR